MCGILFTLSPSSSSPRHGELIASRGPDGTRTHSVSVASRTLTFTFSLLSLRGDTPTFQPLVDPDTSCVLCWNGEAWRIDSEPLVVGTNDTSQVLALLLKAVNSNGDVPGALQRLQGEFAIVFYDAIRGAVWYGRDWAGRRSLLKKTDSDGGIAIASVGGDGDGWVEVDAGGWWRLDVSTGAEEWVGSGMKWELSSKIADDGLAETSPEVEELHQVLGEAVRLRVQGIPDPAEPSPAVTGKPSRLAILFSGGVDCTTLARLAHDHIPLQEPIDLLNVAFENPRVLAARAKEAKQMLYDGNTIDPFGLCPDRITGLASYLELLSVCPGRPWRLVNINIPYAEVVAHRDTIISLMRPHNTEMDLSIAMAFYFASRGIGNLVRPSSTSDSGFAYTVRPYTTSSRILLSGLGADELFGGYTRHATAYMSSGSGSYLRLIAELSLDLSRLPHRNLGRDDRVTANWAKEIRYPFLDEEVVKWATETSVTKKCPFGMELTKESSVERGKMILRLLAKQLGMEKAAVEKKRAVQFGARTAKMEVGRGSRGVKGTDAIS